MAKNVMLSDEIYGELKKLKKMKDKSFSETIRDLLENEKITTGKDLKKIVGIADDKEGWDKHLEEMREGWNRWSERYA